MLRIALSTREVTAPNTGEVRDALARDWTTRLNQWDMLPLPVPKGIKDTAGFVSAVAPDLLVLTGGDDWGVTPDRDTSERELLAAAREHGLPVIGVCRGLQMLNLHFGGTLVSVEGHVARDHAVDFIVPWQAIYGEQVTVNSFHNLAIAEAGLAEPLVAAARDADGFVEAVHHREETIAGVMWHPERPAAPDADRRLFETMARGERFWL